MCQRRMLRSLSTSHGKKDIYGSDVAMIGKLKKRNEPKVPDNDIEYEVLGSDPIEPTATPNPAPKPEPKVSRWEYLGIDEKTQTIKMVLVFDEPKPKREIAKPKKKEIAKPIVKESSPIMTKGSLFCADPKWIIKTPEIITYEL